MTQMDDLDTILDRYSMVKREELEAALVNVSASLTEHFSCRDGYTIVYNAATGKALYYFPGYLDDPIETDISPEQRDYLLKSNYWQRVTV